MASSPLGGEGFGAAEVEGLGAAFSRALRFSADEVFWQCATVVESIYWTLNRTPPPPLRDVTSPPSGEEA